MSELKPCAHCASQPIRTADDWVWCSNQSCELGHKGGGVPVFSVSSRRWNHRPIEDRLRAVNAELVEALSCIANSLVSQCPSFKEIAKEALKRARGEE